MNVGKVSQLMISHNNLTVYGLLIQYAQYTIPYNDSKNFKQFEMFSAI